MCLRVDIMYYLLSAEPEGECAESFLFLLESVWFSGVLLRLLYSGDLQGRLLYDYLPGVSFAQTAVGDEKGLAAPVVLLGSDWGFQRLFCILVEGDVCNGYSASSLFELDF